MEPRIVCSANQTPNGILLLGARHWDMLMHQQKKLMGLLFPPAQYEQGFIDQHGKFYTREEAWEVAHKNGQIIRRCGGDEGRLYSENLY